MANSGNGKPISGVHCVVTSCIHHTENNECVAGSITVGGSGANTKAETDCETYNKHDCCK